MILPKTTCGSLLLLRSSTYVMFFESSTTTAPTIATMSWWQELCPKCHAARRIVLYILKITSHILSWRLQIAIQEILWGPMGGLGGWPWAAPEWISFNRRARFHSKGGYGRNLDRRLKLITSGAAQEGWWSILVNTSKVQSPRYFGVKYCDGYFARRHEGQSNGQYCLRNHHNQTLRIFDTIAPMPAEPETPGTRRW